jgi:glycosyltransferase involved in cell wall biosynthesis
MKHVHIITEHTHSTLACKYAERSNLKISYFLQRVFYPLADKIICVSKGISADLVARVPFIREKVSVIYNPVIDDNFNTMAKMPVDIDLEKFVKGNKVVLGVGRLVPMKDFDLLIDAFSVLLKINSDVVLVIIGDGPLLHKLQEKVNNLGISKYVRFMGHLINPLPYYRYADVFALTSKYEGFGLVLVEALALSKSIVSIDCECGPREILGGVSNLLQTREPESLATELNCALENPGDRGKMTARASEFNVKVITEKYMNEFA